jgi:hypothetical protein
MSSHRVARLTMALAIVTVMLATPATAAAPDPVVTGPIPSSATPGDP